MSDMQTIVTRRLREYAVGTQTFCRCGRVLNVKSAVGPDEGPFLCPDCAGIRNAAKQPRRGDLVIVAIHPTKTWRGNVRVMAGTVAAHRENKVTAFKDARGTLHNIPRNRYCAVAAKEAFTVKIATLLNLIDSAHGLQPTLTQVREIAKGVKK